MSFGAKITVIDVITFFSNYITAIRGERNSFIYEITDGSSHAVDSDQRNYIRATIYAIIDCFDKNYRTFYEHRLVKT